jgi:hypothetical protein
MMQFFKILTYAVRTLAKFIGIAILTFLAVAISFLINSVAMTYPLLWLLAPKFRVLNSNMSHLAALPRFFGLGGI